MFGVVVKFSVNLYIYSPFDLKIGGSYAYFQEKDFTALEFRLLFHPYTYFLLKTWIFQSYKERFAKQNVVITKAMILTNSPLKTGLHKFMNEI